MNHSNYGELLENGTYTGLLGYIYNDEADVIPRVRMDAMQLNLVNFIPLWKTQLFNYFSK